MSSFAIIVPLFFLDDVEIMTVIILAHFIHMIRTYCSWAIIQLPYFNDNIWFSQGGGILAYV